MLEIVPSRKMIKRVIVSTYAKMIESGRLL